MKLCCLILLMTLLPATIASAAEAEARARNLINSLGCKGCHQFEGSGGDFGPALDTAGKKLSAAQIRGKLLDPTRNQADSMMPSYAQFDREDIDVLAAFLAARK